MDFSEINNSMFGVSNYLEDSYFLDILQSNKDREMYTKVEVLDWKERVIGHIQGLATGGNIAIDASSSVRRTCSLSMVVDETTIDVTDISGLIGLNRKIKVYVGLRNTVSGYLDKYGEVIWFPMGVFVLTQGAVRHDTSTNTLNITAQDKMCLLNGEVGGVLQAPVDFASYNQIKEDGKIETIFNVLYDIVRTSVIQYGGENPAKVIVMDVPDEVRKAMDITLGANERIWVDLDTGDSYKQDTPPSGNRRLMELTQTSNRLGYDYVPFTIPNKELLKQAGDTVTSVLDSITGILGNYEYYYDVNGNFIFREIRNHLNQTYKPYYETTSGDYVANFSQNGVFYSFVDKDTISSFSNTPDWSNIKNDFIIWGTKDIPGSDAKRPIMYRVAIDDLPFIGSPGIPWQQQLLDYDKQIPNGLAKSPYYPELSAKWEKHKDSGSEWVYDPETGDFNEDSSFYLDFIDTGSDLGKFSVDNIGRRTKVVVDENVKLLYPLKSSDVVIEYQEEEETVEDFNNRIQETYSNLSADIVKVYNSNTGKPIIKSKVQGAVVLKDAFSTVRELLFAHSTMNEVINISCLPLYNFDVNVKIEAEDNKSNISGYYMVRSVSIPLSIEGQMSISGIRATNRI